MKLQMRRKHKKRLPDRIREPLEVPAHPNHTWSMDFMNDALSDGRRIRILNIADDYNREALAIEVGQSFPAQRVVRVLENLEEEYGLPHRIRVDNGPEFISGKLKTWCNSKSIALKFIQPGKPTQNAYIERFNRTFREDVLDAYWFEDLEQVRILAQQWRDDYNQHHPHSGLHGLSPIEHYQKAIKDGKIKPRAIDVLEKKSNLQWSEKWYGYRLMFKVAYGFKMPELLQKGQKAEYKKPLVA